MPSNKSPSAPRLVRKSSLRTTLFFETFFLLLLTVLAVSVTAFFLSWNELKMRTTSQLQSIAEGKEALLETTVSRQREQLSILGRDPELRNLPSVTALVGFRQLLRIGAGSGVAVLSGNREAPLLPEDVYGGMHSQGGTVFRPIITDEGWAMYIIAAPQMSGTMRTGTLIAIFDAAGLAARILHTDSASKTTEVLLATRLEGGEIILRTDDASDRVVPVRESSGDTLSIVRRALDGEEGVSGGIDYAGIPVLAAFRSVPSLGWAVIAKIDRYEVSAPTLRLAMNQAGTGFMVIVFLSLSTFFLGRRIVGPLEELTKKLDGLETKRWEFRRSIFTGNELEVVDSAADDLTQRLRTSHNSLEAAVRARTRKLAEQLAQDAAILESMDDGLIVTDAEGAILYANRMAQALTGYEQMKGRSVIDVLRILGKDGKEALSGTHPVLSVLSQKAAYRPSVDPQFSLLRKDGKQTALQIRSTPILRGEQCLGTVTVIRDITEERKIDHMKSEFISLVSHQLRTPLSSMRWYLEMLLTDDAKLSGDQTEYVKQAQASNSRMVHLVNALLNVSKIELGSFRVSPEAIKMVQLVRSIAMSFDLESKQKKVEIVLDLPEEDIAVHSDKSLLALILENFLGNALKYSKPHSQVTLTMREHPQKGTLTISVSDSGIGIPAAQQTQIGHKLFRGTNAVSVDTDGNGLGLYISKIATDTIGGTLTFESTEGKGSTFTLQIPKEPRS